MKIKKVISKSADGTRKEVILESSTGLLSTRHIHLDHDGKWRYLVGYIKGKPIFDEIQERR